MRRRWSAEVGVSCPRPVLGFGQPHSACPRSTADEHSVPACSLRDEPEASHPLQAAPPALVRTAPLGGGSPATLHCALEMCTQGSRASAVHIFSASLCCLQVWGNLPECVCQAAHHAQQVFPAHRNGLSGFLSALEAAEQVSSCPVWWVQGGGQPSAGGPAGEGGAWRLEPFDF